MSIHNFGSFVYFGRLFRTKGKSVTQTKNKNNFKMAPENRRTSHFKTLYGLDMYDTNQIRGKRKAFITSLLCDDLSQKSVYWRH